MFFVFEFVIGLASGAMGVAFPAFRHLSRSGAGHFLFSALYSTVFILTMLYFARTESVPSFLKVVGLEHPPSSYVWFAVVVTLALRWGGHVIIVSGWAKGVTTTSFWGFTHSVGMERYLYLAPALMAPFSEELYMRGFLPRLSGLLLCTD
jgi:hypothetical protein